MVAAILAAAISSAAGALSSLTSATMIDFYRRWLRPGADDRRAVRTSRIVMAGWGVLATIAATFLGGGSLLAQVNQIGSMFYGSILGVFLLALGAPRCAERGATIGLLGSLAIVFAVDATLQIAYLWYNLIGAVACMLIGWLVTAVSSPRPAVTVDAV